MRGLLFEAFEFDQAFFKGRRKQVVNRDVFRRRYFGGPAIEFFWNVYI
jgi:hypothetical protein